MKTAFPPAVRLMAAFAAGLGFSTFSFAQSVTTPPVGAVTLSISAGTGVSRSTSVLAFPLVDRATATGQMTGVITGITASSISNSSANWSANSLSQAALPYLIRITSGSATGRTFLLSSTTANTATTLYISSADATTTNLTSLGINLGVDSYELLNADTLSSLLGTPATMGILGGTSAAVSDVVFVFENGAWSQYYFNTNLNRWTRLAFGNPDGTNTVIRPDAAVLYSRLGNSSIPLTITGEVPSRARKATIAKSGVTFLANSWPLASTLSGLSLNNTPGWVSSATYANADKVLIFVSGSWRNYWYDGVNWRRSTFGNPISDSEAIPVAGAVILNRLGVQSGADIVSQSLPYSL